MIARFLIIGLPRSRTAWFANYFCDNPTFCFHELSKDVDDSQLMALPPYSGNSDSGLCLKVPLVKEALKINTKILLINRDFETCVKSTIAHLDNSFSYDNIRNQMNKFKVGFDELMQIKNKNILHVDYHLIDQKLKDIHEFLTPWKIYDGFRAEFLINLRINQITNRYVAG